MSRAREIADRDLAGTELILDADNDTSITADTDDQIDIKVAGNDTAIVAADTVKIRSDNAALVFRRTSSEADIAKVQYVNGNPSLDIGADGKNVRFTNGGSYAETMRVGTNGDVTIQNGDIVFGTSGKGINLGVTSNTDSNTLDDYEEGEFTITTTQGNMTINSSYNKGHYCKIGTFCHIRFFTRFTHAANDNIRFNLPFTTPADATGVEYEHVHGGIWLPESDTGDIGYVGYTPSGTSYITFYTNNDNASGGVMTIQTHAANTQDVYINIMIRTT